MRATLPYHGRIHLPGGVDPIPGIATTLADATYAIISRDGAAGSLGITSGALNATTTVIQHNVESSQGEITTDIISTPSRIVIDVTGLYLLRSTIIWTDTAASTYGITVGWGLNSASPIFGTFASQAKVSGDVTGLSPVSLALLTAGDYITQVAGQNSGSTKTFTYLTNLEAARIVGVSELPQ